VLSRGTCVGKFDGRAVVALAAVALLSTCSSGESTKAGQPNPEPAPAAPEPVPRPEPEPPPDPRPAPELQLEPEPDCRDDDDPNSTRVEHPFFGCGQRWQFPQDDDAAWLEFDSGLHVDEATGNGWVKLRLDLPLEAHEAECAALDVMGVRGWRLPTVDETRRFGAGCDKTASTGPCTVSDPECLSKACAPRQSIEADCWSCNGGLGPGVAGAYCRPNVRLCKNLQTSSNCSDCPGEIWIYEMTNGSLITIAKTMSESAACVHEAMPGFACTEAGCSFQAVDPSQLGEEQPTPPPQPPENAGQCADGDTRCDGEVPLICSAGQWLALDECNGGTQRCNPDTGTCDCQDDADPNTEQYTHPIYGCATVWDLDDDSKGAWTVFDSGVDYDAETSTAWYSSGRSFSQADGVEYCAGLEVLGVSGWRLPSIDDFRGLIAGCDATEPGGTCGVAEGGCLERACGQEAGCNGCIALQGPGVDGAYCRPNVQMCRGTYTSTFCSDCQNQVWGFGAGNGGFSVADATLLRGVSCVRDTLPEL